MRGWSIVRLTPCIKFFCTLLSTWMERGTVGDKNTTPCSRPDTHFSKALETFLEPAKSVSRNREAYTPYPTHDVKETSLRIKNMLGLFYMQGLRFCSGFLRAKTFRDLRDGDARARTRTAQSRGDECNNQNEATASPQVNKVIT